MPEEAIEPFVQARQHRQALLHRVQPPWCRFYMHETALRIPVGDPAVMNDQLLQLVFASARPQLDVRVVPMAAGPLSGPFTMMECSSAKPVVYLENDVSGVFLDGRDHVAYYRHAIARLKTVALDEGESRSLLAELASEHDRPREDQDECISAGGPPLA